MRVNYDLETRLFRNALVHCNTDSHQLSSNMRLNIIHHPLSDSFFVYDERRDEQGGIAEGPCAHRDVHATYWHSEEATQCDTQDC